MIKYIIPVIDYQKIADAKSFYENEGYSELSVPWIIDNAPYKVTFPGGTREFYCLDGYLNASGEQSFIELMMNGQKLTRHLCITPCFRDEPTLDDIHHTYFMKLELIDTDVTKENLHRMISLACQFLNQYMGASSPVRVVQTDREGETFDIHDGIFGIELGSYGIRRTKDFQWIYGTGIALPRLDTVLKKLGQKPDNILGKVINNTYV